MIDMDFFHQTDEDMQNNRFVVNDSLPNTLYTVGTYFPSEGETEICCNQNAFNHDMEASSLFGLEESEGKLFPDEVHKERNISFGMHVEDRAWNLDQAKHYEWLEKREQHEADLDIEKGNVKEARAHAHSAEDARKMKEQYIHAAKSCKK